MFKKKCWRLQQQLKEKASVYHTVKYLVKIHMFKARLSYFPFISVSVCEQTLPIITNYYPNNP